MNKSQTIANRFREVTLNGTWIANTNFKHQLSNLNWKIACTKHKELNSIAILAQHIHYYINGLKNVFLGGNLDIKDKFSFDFKPMESQLEWEEFLNKFWKDSEEFASLIEQMSESKLDEVFIDAKYGSFQRNIDAMIEHSYYHLGQIVLLRKLIEPASR